MQTRTSLALAPLAALTALTACSEPPTAEAPPLVQVAVAAPAGTTGAAYTGVIRARVEAAPGFRVSGKIVARLVDAGQAVRAGQPLFRLDAGDLALAATAAAERVRAAKADAVRTAADERRLQGLVEAGSVSASAYDGARAARDAAAATLAAARAAAANAANEQRYATLYADADGVVTEVLAEPGQVVAAGTPVVRLARSGAREAVVAVPETQISGLGRAAVARLYGSTADVPARLREVAGAADPLTRTFAARYVLVAGSAPPLGATVTVRLGGASDGAVEVPLGALVDRGQGPGVWLVGADRRLAFRPAPPLRLTEETALLPSAAVPAGSRVVALGGQLLRPGQMVRVLAPAVRS